MSVDFVTYCCPKDVHRTYAGWDALIGSHKYAFNEIILIRQRCRGIDAGVLDASVRVLETDDYPDIRKEFDIDDDDPVANAVAPPDNRYYWKWHCWNPLIALKESSADYIMFTDCDNLLDGDIEGDSWVDRGLHILQTMPEILMVCPNQWHEQGGNDRVKAISQCMYLCERKRFLELDWNTPLPEGVSPGSYHYSVEGRLWRYTQKHNLYRMMLKGPPLIIHQAWL